MERKTKEEIFKETMYPDPSIIMENFLGKVDFKRECEAMQIYADQEKFLIRKENELLKTSVEYLSSKLEEVINNERIFHQETVDTLEKDLDNSIFLDGELIFKIETLEQEIKIKEFIETLK